MQILKFQFILIFLLIITTCFSHPSVEDLEKRVFEYNNKLEYKKSQELLLSIILDEKNENSYKLEACILMSYTYKRVQDYDASLSYLNKALEYAQKEQKTKARNNFILSEKAFIYFDIQDYEKSDSMMEIIEKNNFKGIDLENKSKLIMQRAYLFYLKKEFTQSEKMYDEALVLMRQSSPCDLPMIYVKKMQLYSGMNLVSKIEECKDLSLKIADSCGIIQYKIYTYDEYVTILIKLKEYKKMDQAMGILYQLREKYQKDENVASLHQQKEKIIVDNKNKKIEAEKKKKSIFVIVTFVCLFILTVAFMILYKSRKKNKRLAIEFNQMKEELSAFIKSNEGTGGNSSKNDSYLELLTERQIEVLNLLSTGLSNKQIAEKLFLSENTIKFHVKNIYILLNINSRKDLKSI